MLYFSSFLPLKCVKEDILFDYVLFEINGICLAVNFTMFFAFNIVYHRGREIQLHQ